MLIKVTSSSVKFSTANSDNPSNVGSLIKTKFISRSMMKIIHLAYEMKVNYLQSKKLYITKTLYKEDKTESNHKTKDFVIEPNITISSSNYYYFQYRYVLF